MYMYMSIPLVLCNTVKNPTAFRSNVTTISCSSYQLHSLNSQIFMHSFTVYSRTDTIGTPQKFHMYTAYIPIVRLKMCFL